MKDPFRYELPGVVFRGKSAHGQDLTMRFVKCFESWAADRVHVELLSGPEQQPSYEVWARKDWVEFVDGAEVCREMTRRANQ